MFIQEHNWADGCELTLRGSLDAPNVLMATTDGRGIEFTVKQSKPAQRRFAASVHLESSSSGHYRPYFMVNGPGFELYYGETGWGCKGSTRKARRALCATVHQLRGLTQPPWRLWTLFDLDRKDLRQGHFTKEAL